MTSEAATIATKQREEGGGGRDMSLLNYEQRATLARSKKRVIKMKDGRERVYTPPNTFDHRLIISYAKQVYQQLRDLGQKKVTLRTWFYNLEDIEVLKLRESEDPYKLLSKIFVGARKGVYDEDYRMSYSWFIDKKRTEPPERPWRTPQQFVDNVIGRIRNTLDYYPHPMWYNQNDYYIVILVEKDTVVVPVQQLIKKIFGDKEGDEDQIPVIDCGGFSSLTHKRNIYRILKKQEKIGRKIKIFYIGDWDPSGMFIDRDLNKAFIEWGLKNFDIKRIAVTKKQVRDLKLYKAKGTKTMEKLLKDSRHKAFMDANNGELFQTECDAILKAAGLKELKRIIEEDIVRQYWDEEIWQKYENAFTVGKVHKRLIKEIGALATEEIGNSEVEEAINEALDDLEEEQDELREIEGDDDYQEPIDEDRLIYAVSEDEEAEHVELE